MLHRSFKSNKCKTSLKLALSRTKLMKNKKASQVLQLRRELANLLESGHNQTAGIRVEHVVREEKTLAVYDLVEIYCELIAARLPIIDSQKNCPLDLKEAVTSVIFAAPRCTDVPELSDIKKHFIAKYGKEFASSALELRPECGVSRLMVEKLSITPLDGQSKLKILSAVAEEHNVEWDPTTFGDPGSKHADLVKGSSGFVKPAVLYADPPQRDSVQTDPDPGFQRPRPGGDAGAASEGLGSGGREWAMGFKDVTSAARAAAESAERASFAARAAAELSTRGPHTQSPPRPCPGNDFSGHRESAPSKDGGSRPGKSEIDGGSWPVRPEAFPESRDDYYTSDQDAQIEKNLELSRSPSPDFPEPPSSHLEEPIFRQDFKFDDSDGPSSDSDADAAGGRGPQFSDFRSGEEPYRMPGAGLTLGPLKGGLRNKGYIGGTKPGRPDARIERSEGTISPKWSLFGGWAAEHAVGDGPERTAVGPTSVGDDGGGSGFRTTGAVQSRRTARGSTTGSGLYPKRGVEDMESGGAEDPLEGNGHGLTQDPNRAGHVHPKLPDFESLSAHLNSLRLSRD